MSDSLEGRAGSHSYTQRPARRCPACDELRPPRAFSKAAVSTETRCLRCVRSALPVVEREEARLPKLRAPSENIPRECLACSRAFVATTRFYRLCGSCRANTGGSRFDGTPAAAMPRRFG